MTRVVLTTWSMTKIIITTVVGLIASTLVGVWYFSGIDTDMAGVEQKMLVEHEVTTVTANPDQIKGKDSLASLMRMGKSMECTFSFSSDGMKGEGTSYFDKGKSRVDSLYAGIEGGPQASYMISDTETNLMYTWFTADGTTSGMKMNIPTEATADTVPTEQPSTPQVDTNTAVNYDCKPWNVDSSVFVPPTDVEFTDMGEMQKMMEEIQMNMEM